MSRRQKALLQEVRGLSTTLSSGPARLEHQQQEQNQELARIDNEAQASNSRYPAEWGRGRPDREQNRNPESFVRTDVDQAAARLAAILDEAQADVLVCCEWHSNYGHPDHIMVHHVAYRAAELARHRPRVLEQTSNRDDATRMAARPRSPADSKSISTPNSWWAMTDYRWECPRAN